MTYKLGKWSLTDLFPSHTSDEVKTAFETVETLVVEFESYREILDHQMDVEEFMSMIEEMERWIAEEDPFPDPLPDRRRATTDA